MAATYIYDFLSGHTLGSQW